MSVANERYKVHSVDRAVDVIETLASSPNALTLTDLARSIGGSKSSVFATLQTLASRDLVWATGAGQDRRYQLGLGLARLGDIALSQVSFRDAAIPVLRALSAETGLTSRAAAWGGDCAVAIARVNGANGLHFDLHMGARETLHSSSVGKAMLFPMTDEQLRRLLSGIPLPRHTPHTHTTVDEVLADLSEARRRGYAVDNEEDAQDIICVGAPVYDHQGGAIGAISVTRIKSTVTTAQVHELGLTTVRYAGQLSAELGWQGRRSVLQN